MSDKSNAIVLVKNITMGFRHCVNFVFFSDLLLMIYFWDFIGEKYFVIHHLAALIAYYYVLVSL